MYSPDDVILACLAPGGGHTPNGGLLDRVPQGRQSPWVAGDDVPRRFGAQPAGWGDVGDWVLFRPGEWAGDVRTWWGFLWRCRVVDEAWGLL